MRSRAVRRLQEPARWVPAALNAMLFTPWSPHLNLPGRPRLQRPTYEEPFEAGTLPRFMEIPTAPTKNPKSETVTSTPDDTGQSTKRRRQEVTFQEPLQISSSASAAAGTAKDSSMVIPGPQIPKPARTFSPAEREDSVQKRQRPTEVNIVFAFTGGDSRIEISTLTKDPKALHTTKMNELLNMDNFGVVEVVDRPQPQQVLSTRWVSEQRLDGSCKVRLVARGFEQTISSDTDSRKSSCFRRLSQCISSITDAKRIRTIVCGATTGSTVGLFQGMALQESFSGTHLSSCLVYSQHTEKSTT